jgi:hypothetical protein
MELESLRQEFRQLEQYLEEVSPSRQLDAPRSEAAPAAQQDELPQANLMLRWWELRLAPVRENRGASATLPVVRYLTPAAANRWLWVFRIHTVDTFFQSGANQ